MTSDKIKGRIKSICGLEETDLDALNADGIKSHSDLAVIKFEDLATSISVVKRRKLEACGIFLKDSSNKIDASTTMQQILDWIQQKKDVKPPPVINNTYTGAISQASSKTEDGGNKVYIDPLEAFSGDPVDFEDWQIQTESTIRQTIYRTLLDSPPDVTKPAEVSRDAVLYNMFLSAVRQGNAYNMVEKLKQDPTKGESGHYAWKTLTAWYLDSSQKATMAEHYYNKLDNLYLDNDTTATEFINKFDLYVRKIESFDASWSETKKVREFKKRITSEDYDVEKRTHKSGQPLADLIKMIRDQEQSLESQRIVERSTVRRFKNNDDGSVSSAGSSRGRGSNNGGTSTDRKAYIPFILGFLFKSLDRAGKRNVRRWRDMVNAGQTMQPSDLWFPSSEGGGDNKSGKDSPSTKGSVKEKEKKKKRKKDKKDKKASKVRRLTTTSKAGMPDDTIEVKLDSDVEDYLYCYISLFVLMCITCRHDSRIGSSSGLVARKVRMVKRNGDSPSSVAMSRGRQPVKQPVAIIDSGAAEDLVGGVGWRILHESKTRRQILEGAVAGMGTVVLPKVDAVTAITDDKGQVHVVGFGGVTYDRRETQHESLWNSHHMRRSGTRVYDRAKRDGGRQCMKLNIGGRDTVFPFDFDDDCLSLKLREPTDQELARLGVVWILPPMVHHTTQSIRRCKAGSSTDSGDHNEESDSGSSESESGSGDDDTSVSTQATSVEEEVKTDKRVSLKDWKRCLAFPSDEVVKNTLQNTTQYCAEPVEMERRELPRQHRKKRLYPLHPRRLWGRTDSDTFFSSIKSIRNHTCVQLFVHVNSDYLFVRCMQREKHSHGAFQDFIREMGAPNVLLTDNSKTQTGKKWTATSRQYVIKQRTISPHNQQQNKAERRIQDVKNKLSFVMDENNAPLEFWCYALIYVVDCLNHVSKKKLDGRTSEEVLNGDTPDISPFRFSFWQLVEYYEPTASCPESKWKRARFLGIAWESGDAFTFKLWIEDEDVSNDGETTDDESEKKKKKKSKKRKGREITRNIVRASRKEEAETPKIDRSGLKFQKKVVTRKRRRGKKVVFHHKLVDLEPLGDDTDSEEQGADESQRNRSVTFEGHPPHSSDDTNLEEEGDSESDNDALDGSFATVTDTDAPNSNGSNGSSGNGESGNDMEMMREINDQFSVPDERPEIGGSRAVRIMAHEWRNAVLHFKIVWSDESTTWESILDMKEDYPRVTAQYIIDNNVKRSRRGRDDVQTWAKKTLRDCNRAIRRITRLYDFFLDDDDTIRKVRRTAKGGKKKKKFSSKPVFKYGIEVPRNAKRALEIDKANENHVWRDSMKKEVDSLLELDCFNYEEKGYDPGPGWQTTTLHMVFDVKHDLRRKSRLVAGGHLVDLVDVPYYSSTVKTISVQLLHVIADKVGLKELCGDIGNAFPNAYTSEKVYVPKAGPEFGENEGKAIVIKKALYGLRSSAERFHTHLADSMKTFGFKQTRFDNDVWIRRREGKEFYEYVCTHVDDFMIVSDDPEAVMKEIESVYLVKSDSKGPPEYYLGNDYKKNESGRWCIGCKKYLKEAIRRIEDMFEKDLPKKDTPMADGDHPEEDTSTPLNDEFHRKYQMLIGILNWVVCLGRVDVAFAVSSLSRFSAAPRQGHLDRAFRVFGYLKKYCNRRYVIDSRDPIFVGGEDALNVDYTEIFREFYPDAAEEVDSKIPEPLIDELARITPMTELLGAQLQV